MCSRTVPLRGVLREERNKAVQIGVACHVPSHPPIHHVSRSITDHTHVLLAMYRYIMACTASAAAPPRHALSILPPKVMI